MKILHVLSSPRAQGTPRLVLDWLNINSFEQEVLFLNHQGDLKEVFERTKVWRYYNNLFDLKFINILKIIRLVKKISKERNPDLIIAWPTGFSHWIALGARQAKVKDILVHMGNPTGGSFAEKYIHTWLCFGLGRLAGAKNIACSEYVRKDYLKIPLMSPAYFFSVYNCFMPENFASLGVNRDDKTAIMVATLEGHKDHDTLLRAWRRMEDTSEKLVLQLAGDGSKKKELQELTKNLKLKKVKFLGSRNDVPELLQSSVLFILSTTEKEGFGTVLLEALAAGLIIIATDVPACREVLQNGKYGSLVPPKDPEALAQAILNAFENPLTDEQRQAQIAYASRFTPENMMRQYLEIAGFGEEASKLKDKRLV